MWLVLLLLFTLIPIVELSLLLRLGAAFGIGPTLVLVIGTGLAGAHLTRREGARSWRAVQEQLAAGKLPTEELLGGLFVLIAGILLVTPGVLTDVAGLLLLVRPTRRALIGRVRAWLGSRVQVQSLGDAEPPDEDYPPAGRIIDL